MTAERFVAGAGTLLAFGAFLVLAALLTGPIGAATSPRWATRVETLLAAVLALAVLAGLVWVAWLVSR